MANPKFSFVVEVIKQHKVANIPFLAFENSLAAGVDHAMFDDKLFIGSQTILYGSYNMDHIQVKAYLQSEEFRLKFCRESVTLRRF